MPDSDSRFDPLPHLVRQLRPFEERGEDYELVDEDRLIVLAANVYMLRAITNMWRNILIQQGAEAINVYGDDMLAYEICNSIAYIYSEDVTSDSGFESIFELGDYDVFDMKVFEALSCYLDLLHEAGDIGNDIWKRSMEAMYSICIKSEACRSVAQSISESQMKVDSRHWSVELIKDLAER
jgi:hypothetical protein